MTAPEKPAGPEEKTDVLGLARICRTPGLKLLSGVFGNFIVAKSRKTETWKYAVTVVNMVTGR